MSHSAVRDDAKILEMMLLKLTGGNVAQASEALLKVIGKCNLIDDQIILKLEKNCIVTMR